MYKDSSSWTRRGRTVLGFFAVSASVASFGACSAHDAETEESAAVQPSELSLRSSERTRHAPEATRVAPHSAGGCADHADEHENPHEREHAAHRVHWKRQNHRRDRTKQIKILGINDFHGQLSAGKMVGGRPVGGAAVLAAYLQDAQERAVDGALIVHAGDHVGASPPASALLQDEPAITFLNLLTNRHCRSARHDDPDCNVIGTLGNHEFDEGKHEMLRLIYGGNHEEGPFLQRRYRGARFSYVSANVVDEETGRPLLPAYTIRRLEGVRVGMIGAVLKETPTIVTPSGVAGLAFLDEAEAINRAVRNLKRKGVAAIGVTIHQGGQQSSFEGDTAQDGAVTGPIVDIVAQLDAEVDFVVSGHAHGFTNALLPNSAGIPVLVTQAFSASTAYGEIDLSIDVRSGDVVEKSARIITSYADQAPGVSPPPEVLDLVAQAEALTDPLVNEVVAQAQTDITRTETAAGESALGNLIADAQRAATGAEIACMNPGGIRADLEAGDVTWGELFTIQPFGNSLVTMDLTGAQLLEMLNQQWIGQSFPRILKCSGLTYTWDDSIPVGENRITEAFIGTNHLDMALTYRVTVNSFLAAGGDNFTVLPQGTNLVGGDVDLDALITHVQGLEQPFSAMIEGRITVVPVVAP